LPPCRRRRWPRLRRRPSSPPLVAPHCRIWIWDLCFALPRNPRSGSVGPTALASSPDLTCLLLSQRPDQPHAPPTSSSTAAPLPTAGRGLSSVTASSMHAPFRNIGLDSTSPAPACARLRRLHRLGFPLALLLGVGVGAGDGPEERCPLPCTSFGCVCRWPWQGRCCPV
jgi:hypothetical protein